MSQWRWNESLVGNLPLPHFNTMLEPYRVTELLASPLLAKIDKTFQIQFCSNDVVQQDKLDTLNTTNVCKITKQQERLESHFIIIVY